MLDLINPFTTPIHKYPNEEQENLLEGRVINPVPGECRIYVKTDENNIYYVSEAFVEYSSGYIFDKVRKKPYKYYMAINIAGVINGMLYDKWINNCMTSNFIKCERNRYKVSWCVNCHPFEELVQNISYIFSEVPKLWLYEFTEVDVTVEYGPYIASIYHSRNNEIECCKYSIKTFEEEINKLYIHLSNLKKMSKEEQNIADTVTLMESTRSRIDSITNSINTIKKKLDELRDVSDLGFDNLEEILEYITR